MRKSRSATAPFIEALGRTMDTPKLLKDPSAVEARLSQLGQPHIAPLTAFVERLRGKMGSDAAIPYFDPWDGGVNAEVLFLLEAPGPKAKGSGFISRNNPDETAKNFFMLNCEAGIARTRTVTWNVVPWYIGTGKKIRPANSSDISSGVESLSELLQLFPKLRIIVLLGAKSQQSKTIIQRAVPGLKVFTCPHPSPMFINRSPENRAIVLKKLQAVSTFLEAK